MFPKIGVTTVAEGREVIANLERRLHGPGPLHRNLMRMDRDASHREFGGFLLFRSALRCEELMPALVSGFDWAARGTCRTAWAVRCRCPYSYGTGPAVGPQTGVRSWELLRGLWRAFAPSMTPCSSGGEVPLGGSCARWHSDDEGSV